jgi:hypothetical protein
MSEAIDPIAFPFMRLPFLFSNTTQIFPWRSASYKLFTGMRQKE